MLISITTLLATLSSIFRSRAALELENLALRHQIGVLQRSAAKRPKLTSGDRLLWICLSRLWRDWRSALAIVKPETVIAWHRKGFRLFWTWKVRHSQPGRPVISREVRDLIRKMCRRISVGVRPASMANCSNSASTSQRAASANTWCAAANRRLRATGKSLESYG
jgi:putative transposase